MMNLPRSNLPTRIPGAHLTKPLEPPQDGWFGTPVEWPTEDEDLKTKNSTQAIARYFDGCRLPDDQHKAEELLQRVLDGVKRINGPP